jgi:hypothetical protein
MSRTSPFLIGVIETPPPPPPGACAVEFEQRIPPSGDFTLVTAGQKLGFNQGMAGWTVTIWAD